MKSTLPLTYIQPSLKTVPKTAPVLPYTGMYIKVNNWRKCEKPSPFKAQFQTGSLVKESENWDTDWFAHYE